ncbi:MAG: response regulator [Anaerolineae bacterium]
MMGDKRRILIVEDEPGTLQLMCHIVGRAGYEPISAAGGHEALELLEQDGADLILLDLMMKGLDGWRVLDVVKQSPELRAIPVIIVSARAPSEQLLTLEAHAGMFEDYFIKPFHVDDLVARIGEVLEKGPTRGKGAKGNLGTIAWTNREERLRHKEFVSSVEGKTMATLFDLAITAEVAAQDLYRALARSFGHVPQVAAFWQDLMHDEETHAAELRKLCNSLPAGQLLAPVAPSLVSRAEKGLELAQEDYLSQIETLDDAFQIAQVLESSEINALFELLMSRYLEEQDKNEIIVSQLRNHTTKLLQFEQEFGNAEVRNKVLAQD